MCKVIFTKGLPACGKSTWAKEFVQKNQNYVRVNRDDLRRMRGKYWLPKQEDLISAWEDALIVEALKLGYNVIVDATNLNPKHYQAKVDMINNIQTNEKIEIENKEFYDVSLAELIRRDAAREDQVGEKVITGMYNKYFGSKERNLPKLEQYEGYPHVIICDLDGTLALLNGRDPYDASTCDQDLVNPPVLNVLRARAWGPTETGIIFVSGREDKYRPQTERFLSKVGLCPCGKDIQLFMRRTGDNREDSIIKKEIFDDNIREQYYVEFVMDDRSRVVKMWRELGLTCFQVAPGDF